MRGGYRQNAGRKKGFPAIEAEKAREFVAHRLVTELGLIVDKAIEQAKDGNHRAREWLVDRAYGKASQAMSIDLDGQLSQVSHVLTESEKETLDLLLKN